MAPLPGRSPSPWPRRPRHSRLSVTGQVPVAARFRPPPQLSTRPFARPAARTPAVDRPHAPEADHGQVGRETALEPHAIRQRPSRPQRCHSPSSPTERNGPAGPSGRSSAFASGRQTRPPRGPEPAEPRAAQLRDELDAAPADLPRREAAAPRPARRRCTTGAPAPTSRPTRHRRPPAARPSKGSAADGRRDDPRSRASTTSRPASTGRHRSRRRPPDHRRTRTALDQTRQTLDTLASPGGPGPPAAPTAASKPGQRRSGRGPPPRPSPATSPPRPPAPSCGSRIERIDQFVNRGRRDQHRPHPHRGRAAHPAPLPARPHRNVIRLRNQLRGSRSGRHADAVAPVPGRDPSHRVRPSKWTATRASRNSPG